MRDEGCGVALQCHPQCPVARRPATAVDAIVGFQPDGGLRMSYRCKSLPEAIRIPERKAAVAMDELWRATCCELFVGAGNGLAYREFNFSPSGEWAVYGFLAYRQRDDFCYSYGAAPDITFVPSHDGWTLTATIPSTLLDHVFDSTATSVDISVTAVLEAADGALSYWALTHPREIPDFHDRAGFILQTSLPVLS